MSFNLQFFAKVTTSSNTEANTMYAYSDSASTISQIKASAFFNDIDGRLVVGDLIVAKGSAGNPQILAVTAVSPNVTTVQLDNVADASITTDKILDANVTLAKLATGIAPSHVIKFGGKHSGAGGSATVTITAAGVTTSHLVFAQIQSSANAVNVQKVTPTADTITVLCSADPGACVVTYQASLAAA